MRTFHLSESIVTIEFSSGNLFRQIAEEDDDAPLYRTWLAGLVFLGARQKEAATPRLILPPSRTSVCVMTTGPILEGILIRGDFGLKIFEKLFERLSFIGLDKMIHQFQGADGAGKVVVQIDCEFFLAHVPIAVYPLSFVRTLTRHLQTHNAHTRTFRLGSLCAQSLGSLYSHRTLSGSDDRHPG
jgi:hypothetical protein